MVRADSFKKSRNFAKLAPTENCHENQMRIDKTDFSRKIDAVGRIVVPAKLRERLGLEIGNTMDYYLIYDKEDKYLAFKCPKRKFTIDELVDMKLRLEELGYYIEDLRDIDIPETTEEKE